jgi:hypothetical protein
LINFLCREKFVMPAIPEELFGRASKCILSNGSVAICCFLRSDKTLNIFWLRGAKKKFSAGRFQLAKRATAQNPRSPFLASKSEYLFDPYSPLSSTGIDEVKSLSILFIHIMFLIAVFPLPNSRFLQGEVISATERRGEARMANLRSCSPSSSRTAMKMNLMPAGNYLQQNVVYSQTK